MWKTTNFIIQDSEQIFHSNSLNIDFKWKQISVKRWNVELSYYELNNLRNITSLEVIRIMWNKEEKILFKEYILEWLKQFLIDDSETRTHRFDCRNFAHQLNNIDYTSWFDYNDWYIKVIDNISKFENKWELLIWDTILLWEKRQVSAWVFEIWNITHMAIYIWRSLYIQKFGTDKIIVTNYIEMMKAFKWNKFLRLRPRKDKQITK